MLTRQSLTHQYGFGGYYAEPYHVIMLEDAYPPGTGQGRPQVARFAQVPLNQAVTAAGAAGFKPYVGMDPTDPGTYSRPYAPQRGMFARLHQDQAAAAAEQARQDRYGKGKRARRG